MKRLLLLTFCFLTTLCSFSQNGNFIFLTSTGKLYSVNVDSKADTFGVPKPITILPKKTPYTKALSIALNKDSIYITESTGLLWSGYYNKATLTVTMNAKALYQFPNTKSYGLTVDNQGIIYAGNGTNVDIYNPKLPANKQPASISLTNSKGTSWTCGGDLIFWGGDLYETVENSSSTIQGIIKINLSKGAVQDTLFSFDPNKQIFGISSVNVPCQNNQTFALSNDGNVYPLDLYKHTLYDTPLKDNTFSINSIVNFLGGSFTIYDAASIAESGIAQRPPPPANPVTPNDICQGQPFSFASKVNVNDPSNDTLRWYTAPNLPPLIGTPSVFTGAPAINTNLLGPTRYVITEFSKVTKCESDTVSIIVNVHPYPTKPVIFVSADTICSGSTSALVITTASKTAGASYDWYNTAGATGSSGSAYSAKTTSSYAVTATNFGCSTTSDSVKIKALSSSVSYVSSPFCNTGTALVTQTGDNEGGVYSSTTGLIIDSKTGKVDLANSAEGTYTVTYTLNGSKFTCPYTSNITINASTTSNSTASICKGNSYNFNGTNYTNAGTYTAKLTNSKGCDSTAKLILTVGSPTTSSTPVTVCQAGIPYNWNGHSYSGAGTYLVHLTNSAGCDSAATLVLTVNNNIKTFTPVTICATQLPYIWSGKKYTVAGSYSDTLTNNVGCDSISTLMLSVNQKETVDAITGPTSVDVNKSIKLTDLTFGGVWSVSPNTVSSIDNSGNLTGLVAGKAVVSYTIPNSQCGSDTAFYSVNVTSLDIFIPNLFSPNGDNKNPVFYVRGAAATYSSVELTVFDSWGSKIFESNGNLNDKSIGWNGDYKGKPQPVGAYIYVAKLTVASSGEKVTKKGIINLIR